MYQICALVLILSNCLTNPRERIYPLTHLGFGVLCFVYNTNTTVACRQALVGFWVGHHPLGLAKDSNNTVCKYRTRLVQSVCLFSIIYSPDALQ